MVGKCDFCVLLLESITSIEEVGLNDDERVGGRKGSDDEKNVFVNSRMYLKETARKQFFRNFSNSEVY